MVKAGLRWMLATAGAMAASTLVLVGAFGAVAASGATALEQVEITGLRHLDRLEVLKAAGLDSTTQLIALRVGHLQRRLEAMGWVKKAQVSRRWPHTLVIRITERRPAALGVVEGRLWYLDKTLSPFAPATQVAAALVVISGLSRDEFVTPDEEVRALLKCARELLEIADSQGRLKGIGRLSEVHLERVWGVCVVVEELQAVIRLGVGNIAHKIEAVAKVLKDLKRRGELGQAKVVDAGASGKVVVQLAGEGA